jgi:hypothetical protein
MTALALQYGNRGNVRESARIASETMPLLESVDDPTSTIGAATALASVRHAAGESADVLRWSQTVIQWADGEAAERDPTRDRR